jgi:hypothetical protein
VEGLGGALLLTLEQPLAPQAAGVAPSDLEATSGFDESDGTRRTLMRTANRWCESASV